MIHHSQPILDRLFPSRFYFLMMLCLLAGYYARAQYVNVPVTGFNNDIVANGTGASSIPGVTYPGIGVDGANYWFIDNTFRYTPTSALPTCFMPVSGTAASLRTPGLTYNFQSYTGNNAMSIDNNSTSYTNTSLANTGTLTLVTPASYGVLYVLYESVVNVSPMVVDVTVTFTDATTQTFNGNTCVNWFTATLPAFNNVGRSSPTGGIECGSSPNFFPNMFELQLAISPANQSKQVQSITFTLPASYTTGTTASSVNYFHAMAVGGIAPCAVPVDQPSGLSLASNSASTADISFTAAPSAPSGYLVVAYPTGATPVNPVGGTNYVAGNILGNGRVVSSGTSTSVTATGLLPGVTYDIYVYSLNSGSCAVAYNTIAPLTGSVTISSAGASTLINPFGDGGFENGPTFTDNGWTVVNGTTVNKWFVGTGATPFAGSRAAYIDNGTGATNAYTTSANTTVHFYRDVSFPAGQSLINLSFRWKTQGEGSYDYITCYVMPTSVTPVANSPAGAFQSWLNFPTAYSGAVIYSTPPNLNLQGATYQTQNICLPGSFAGTTQRLVFAWVNDGSGGTQPPGAIDDITLVASIPAAPASQATNLTLTAISTSQIDGTFTAASGSPSGYLVVRYPAGSAITNPVDGTTYTTGATLGLGRIVYAGSANNFSATGLNGSTSYDFYVYAYNNIACLGLAYNTVSPLLGTQATNACGSLTGVIPVGPTAPASPAGFTNLTTALAYINVNGIGGNTILELQPDYVSTTETYPIVFPFNACIFPSQTLTVRPAATVVSPLVISTSNATATIDLNGASNIIIDGRAGGSGTAQMLRIVNTATTAISTVRFINDANNNLLTYCDVQGSSTTVANPTTAGIVYIGGTTGLNGNDNNTISYCDIHSAGTALPAIGVGAFNSTTLGSNANNHQNTISNCNIYDFFAAAAATTGMKIDAGNHNYTITNNHFYQTATRAFTGAVTFRFLWLNSNSAAANVTHSSGHTVTGNYMGGSSADGSGTMTITGSSTSNFMGMDISVGNGTGTTVSQDTLTNISFSSTNISTSGSGQFSGISINYGNVNTIANNVIGATGSGINVVSTGATVATNVSGLRIGGGILANTISGNKIGNINANMTANTVAHSVFGILLNGGTTSPTISNNEVGPLASGTASTTATGSAQVIGISTNVSLVSPTISNNIIRDLSNYAPNSNTGGTGVSVIGINLNGTSISTVCNINNNTIYNLTNRATSTSLTFAAYVQGIFSNTGTGATVNMNANWIHSFSTPNWNTAALTTTGIPVYSAINTVSGATYNITNNMIRLGIDGNGNDVTQPVSIRAIFRQATTGTLNCHHNSVFVGGTNVSNSTAATQSAAFFRNGTSTADNIRSNIFVNLRNNASTSFKHYAIYLGANSALTLDGNLYHNNGGTGNLFGYNGTADVATYSSAWISSDLNSQTGDPQFVNAIGNASIADLHLNNSVATPAEQNGVFIGTVLNDYDGQTRAGLTPVDIGADAGNFIPVNPCSGPPPVPVAALTNAAPICGSGTKTIILSAWLNQPGFAYQWQESVSGTPGTFTDVSTGVGANANSYTTPTLSSPMYYQCRVTCTITGDSVFSNTVLAQVNANPSITITPATGTNVCSGANVDLTASGAATYTWSVNPGVSGYPVVSLLSTPNNLAKVTSRPTSTLASSTATPPATVNTPTWIYTVTGTDAFGCTSTASVSLGVITSATVPVQLTYTYAPDPICEPNIPVTFTVENNGVIGSGQWVYNWYDNTGNTLLQTAINGATSDTYTPATPTANGNYSYLIKVSNTVCPSSYAVASPRFFVGYNSLNIVSNANCGNNGAITVYPEGQTDLNDWYVNNFATGLLGPAFDASFGNTNFTGGICNITPQANSQNGTLLIRNPSNINTNNLQVDFKLSTHPRGFAFNILGADGLAWSYGPDVFQGLLTPGTAGFNAESGSGSGFKLAFDATANGAQNTPGAYLMYNCTTPDQGPTSPGVLAFKQGSWWQGLINAPVSIQISENGFVTVIVNNEVIFDHVPLPTAYLTANKSNWRHAFTARTGGSNQLHAIDDLAIRYNLYEYSINSTTGNDGSWQMANTFNGLAPGSYPTWVRKLSDPSCFSQTGTVTIGVDPSPSSAATIVAPGSNEVVCFGGSTTLTTNVSVPGAVFLWEEASALGGPWNPAIGTNNDANYITPGLTADTYYRLTFTCPSATPVTSTPKLITVNAGSILSTNSPQQINCIGDQAVLTAVPGPNSTVAWYNTATGGSALSTSNSYTVTPTSLPATYYVEPVTTVYSLKYFNGGQTVIANSFGTAATGTSISTRFSTTASIILDSIKVLPGATGTLTIALQNAGSATNIASVNFTVTSAMVGNFVNVPLNLVVPASGNYQITTSGVACTYYSSYSGSYAAPYMTLGGVFSITGAATSPTGASSTALYGTMFRVAISATCPAGSGARIPVVVTNNPAYLITVTALSPNTCVGTIKSFVASSPTAYSSYEWSPVTDLYTDPGATIPYTAGTYTATVYVKPSTPGTKTYTVSAAPSGCANTATGSIIADPLPNVIASAQPASLCSGGTSQLTAIVPTGVYTISSISFAPEATPANTSTVSGDENTQTVSIGFPFNYFGTNYTDVIIHTNGYIQMGGSTPVCLTCYTPPAAPATSTPNNWAGIWGDLNVTAGQVTYGVTGVQPNRKFIVNYDNVNYWSASPATTHQIILNEADQSVEIHVTSNTTTSTNPRVLGIENDGGTVAFIPAGRNAGTWTTSNEAWKFTPVSGNYQYDWSANSTYLSATNIANPLAQGMLSSQTYTVQATDQSTGCTQTASASVTVNVPTSSTQVQTACDTYSWNSNTYTTSGTYTATTQNAAGCDSVQTLVLTINTSSSSLTTISTCGSYSWNSNTYTSTGTYTFTTLNAGGCDSLATLDLTITPCNSVLNLNLYIQGYWDGVSGMQSVLFNQGQLNPGTDCDTILVELHDAMTPSIVAYSTTAVLQTNGLAVCTFPVAISGNYYIAVKHRNAVETWSANPLSFGAITNYNFTTAATQAYGDNQIEISTGIWAFYSGDVVKDLAESTDLLDLAQMEFEISNFSFGYYAEDLTGDGNVDLNDSPILETNILNFVSSVHP